MADRFEILINAILKKTTKQELEQQLKKYEQQLQPIDLKIGISQEAEIKLYKSMQKIYKEEERLRLNQEKSFQKAQTEKEKQLQYEQKIRQSLQQKQQQDAQKELDWKIKTSNALSQQRQKEEQVNKTIQERIRLYQQSFQIQSNKLTGKYGSLVDSDALSQLQGKVSGVSLKNFNHNALKEYNLELQKIQNNAINSGRALKLAQKDAITFGDELVRSGFKFTEWYLLAGAITGFINSIKSSITYIYELDNTLNEIRIVTNQTVPEVYALAKGYNALAKEMNVTTKEIASTSVELYRQGLNQAQVDERMKSIIQYAKISGISLADSNKIITATANATGESVVKIIDIFAQLGDKTASGADEIGEALQKVASTSESMGVSLEKAAAWIATISSKTRESASVIGNSLKGIMSRYSQIKEKGFNDEDATNLNQVVKALKDAAQIDAIDKQTGQLRNFSDIIDELMGKWNQLAENNKRYVATTLAGTFQMNRFLTLMNNSKDVAINYEIALNSAGTAQQKFEIYQESSAAKVDKLKATIEGLWQNLVSSTAINTAISGFTSFIEAIVRVTDTIGGLNTILLTLSVAILPRLPVLFASFQAALGSLLTSPVGLATIAVGGLVTAIFALINVHAKEREELEKRVKNNQTEINQLTDLKNKYNDLLELQKQGLNVNTDLKNTEEEILKLLPKKEQAWNSEYNAIMDINKALDEQILKKQKAVANDLSADVYQIFNREGMFDNGKKTGTWFDSSFFGDIKKVKELEKTISTMNENLEDPFVGNKYALSNDIKRESANKERILKQVAIEADKIVQYYSAKYNVVNDKFLKDVKSNILSGDVLQSQQLIENVFKNYDFGLKDTYEKTREKTKPNIKSEVSISGSKEKPETGGSSESDISYALLEKERYTSLNQELENTNQLLERNKALQELDDQTKKVELLEEEQKLLKLKQDALHAINEERRTEKSELQSRLSSSGVQFNNEEALNMELVLQQKIDAVNSHRFDKDKSYYNQLKEEYDDLQKAASRFYELEKEIPKTSTEWLRLETEISKTTDAINDFNNKQLEAEAKLIKDTQELLKKTADEKIKSYEDAENEIVDLLKKKYDKQQKLAEKNNKEEIEALEKKHKKEIDKLEKSKKEYEDYVDDRIKALDRLKDAEDYSKDVDEISQKIIDNQKEINNYNLAVKSGDLEAIAKVAELTKEKTDLEKDLEEKQNDRTYELRKQTLQDLKDEHNEYIDNLKDQKEQDFEDTKDFLDKQLQATKDANDKLIEDANLKLEAEKLLIEGTNEQITNNITNLFTITGENATKTGQIIQNTLLSKLSQIKQIYSELENLKIISKNNGVKDSDMILVNQGVLGRKVLESVSSVEARQRTRYDNATSDEDKMRITTETSNVTGRTPNWAFDSGGEAIGIGLLPKNTLRPERVLSPDQTLSFNKFIDYLPNMSNLLNNILPNISIPNIQTSGIGGVTVEFGSLLNIGNLSGVDKSSLLDMTQSAAEKAVRIIKKELGFGGQFRK